MRRITTGLLCLCAALALADVAARAKLGVTPSEMEAVVLGWSAQKDLIGRPVMNDDKDRAKIGRIEDLIISSDNTVSWAIIGTGGFLGIGRHDVAIPMNQLRMQTDGLLLPGATREALKALPPFDYASKRPMR